MGADQTITHPPYLQRLRPVLMSDPEIGPRLCQLADMFGYPPEPECAPAAGAAAGASGGGDKTGGQAEAGVVEQGEIDS